MIVRIEKRGFRHMWFVSDVPFGVALARGTNWSRRAAEEEAARKVLLIVAQRELEALNGNS